jgi:hypothetical protein
VVQLQRGAVWRPGGVRRLDVSGGRVRRLDVSGGRVRRLDVSGEHGQVAMPPRGHHPPHYGLLVAVQATIVAVHVSGERPSPAVAKNRARLLLGRTTTPAPAQRGGVTFRRTSDS